MNRTVPQHPLWSALIAVLFAIVAMPLAAQDPDLREILRTVEEAEEARWEGVRSVTLTHRTLGLEMTARKDISFVDGRRQADVTFIDVPPRLRAEEMEARLPGQMPVDHWHDTPADEVRWEGTVRREGRELDRIVIYGPVLPDEAIAMVQDEQEGFEFEVESVELLVDRTRNLIPEISLEGRMINPETGRSGQTRISMIEEDHVEVEGLLFPRRTVMRTQMPPELMVPEGEDPEEFAAFMADPEALAEMMEFVQREMDSRSPEERAGIEAAMAMLAAFQSDGAVEMESELVDVQVERR